MAETLKIDYRLIPAKGGLVHSLTYGFLNKPILQIRQVAGQTGYFLLANLKHLDRVNEVLLMWCVCLTKSEPFLNETDGKLSACAESSAGRRAPNRTLG